MLLKYFLKAHTKLNETNAPDGYLLNDADHFVTIDASETEFEVVVENEQEKTLSIKKVSQSNTDIVLSGAEFEVYDVSNNVVATLTTDDTGMVSKVIPKGTYSN